MANRITAAATVLLLLAGCGMSEYEDITANTSHSQLIGQRLEARSQLYIHAVTLDPNYAKRVDLYSVTPPPGFSGPELIYRDTLPAGTGFKVLSVRRCTNCPFEERIELLVQPIGTDRYRAAPVEVSYDFLEIGALFVVRS